MMHVRGARGLVLEEARPRLVDGFGDGEGHSADRREGPAAALGHNLAVKVQLEGELLRLLPSGRREVEPSLAQAHLLVVDVEHDTHLPFRKGGRWGWVRGNIRIFVANSDNKKNTRSTVSEEDEV